MSDSLLVLECTFVPQFPQNLSCGRSMLPHNEHGTRSCCGALLSVAFRVKFRGENEDDRGFLNDVEYAPFPVSIKVRPASASSLLKILSTSTLPPEGEASAVLLLLGDANEKLDPVSNELRELQSGGCTSLRTLDQIC